MVNNNLKRIILLFGVKQSGKDTAGEVIKNILPNAKTFAFADELKQVAHKVFGIPLEWLYGTNDDKNRETNIRWSDLPLPPDTIRDLFSQLKQPSVTRDKTTFSFMTVREFLIVFGTEVCRKMYNDCWVNATLNTIYNSDCETAIITDGRFPNELRKILENNHGEGVESIVIGLTRNPYAGEHQHDSELGVEHIQNYLDTSKMQFTPNPDHFVMDGKGCDSTREVILWGFVKWYNNVFILENHGLEKHAKDRYLTLLINFLDIRDCLGTWKEGPAR